MTERKQVVHFKVVLLGEGRVGKTSLLVRFVENKFSDRQQATVQAAPFMPKPLVLGSQQVELSLWDTAGQERFHSLGPLYYRDAHAALLVFDITDIDSFNRVKAWVTELKQMVGPDIVLTIAANKSDLEKERSVPDEVVKEYATSIGAAHFSTSAKTGAGLELAFQDLARRCIQQQREKLAKQAPGQPTARRRHGGLVIADDSYLPPQKGSSCC